MNHIAAAEEQIVSDRLRRKLNEVNAAAQAHLSGVQDHVNFTLQQAYFKCAYECFDRRRRQEEISNCVEHCSVPVVSAQQHVENEMAKFQMALNTGNLSLRSVLEKDKLSGNNFLDWYRNLRIVLKHEKKLYVLDEPAPPTPEDNAPRTEKDAYRKYLDDVVDVECLMLVIMNPEQQKQHENMAVYDMIVHLKQLYQGLARHERFDVSKALFQTKLREGCSVGPHVLKMIGYVESLERLDFPLGQELATDLILQSLPESYSQFVMNYNMNELGKTLPELLSLLRTAEQIISKGKSVLVVQNQEKKKGKNTAKKAKKGFRSDLSALKPKAKAAKDGNCFHCGKGGHWKRNCGLYLEETRKNKESGASTSGPKGA